MTDTDIPSLIGRDDVNDLMAILEVSNSDMNEVVRNVQNNCDTIFTWDYEKGQRPALEKLYEKAKDAQWNGETDLDWSIDVDIEKTVMANAEQNGLDFDPVGTPFEKWDEKQWLELGNRVQQLVAESVHAR